MTIEPAPQGHWESFREEQRNHIALAMISSVSDPLLEALTVSDIAARAGMSRKTFYKYFDSLQAATSYTYGMILKTITRGALETISPNWSGLDKFLHILEQLAHTGTTNPHWIRFISYFDHSTSGLQESEQESVQELTSLLFSDFAEQFERGQLDGSIRADLAVKGTVLAISTAVIAVLQRCILLQPRTFSGQSSAQIIELELRVWRSYLQSGENN